jgi:Fibronectin type III domain
MKRLVVVLRLGSQTIPEKIDTAKVIVLSMTGNEYFATPTPELKTITALADELQLAYEVSRDGTKEQTALMYAKEFELVTQLNVLSNYVQATANNDIEIGDAIIFSAGMDVKRPANRQDRKFRVRNTDMAGSVTVETKSEGRAGYVWEYSVDQETWTKCKFTQVSTTTITDLTPGSRYYFRVAVVTDEQGPWQGPINIIVT